MREALVEKKWSRFSAFFFLFACCCSGVLDFNAYKLIPMYAEASAWRPASARIFSLRPVPNLNRCYIKYNYSVGNRTYDGNRATVDSEYG